MDRAQTRLAKAATLEGSPQVNGGALHLGRAAPLSEIEAVTRDTQFAVTEFPSLMQPGNTLFPLQRTCASSLSWAG